MMDKVFNTSEARLASVLDTAADGIVIIDADARVLMFNKACEEMFGMSQAEVYGRNVHCIMPPEYADKHDQFLTNYLETGEKKIIGIGREVLGQHKDGTVFPVELSVGEAETPAGRQFIGILRDLRPRQESQQRLNDLQSQLVHMARLSAMDEMGATLAHELNQPLTAIMLYLQAVERHFDNQQTPIFDERARQIINKAVHEADRAGAIIQRLRQFVERREIERQTVDLGSLVDDAIELAALGARAKGIFVRIDRPEDPVLVHVDPIQIQQIVINLVRNAIDAMHDNPEQSGETVTVSIERHNATADIAVEDTGPGIAPEVRDRLFRAFTSTKQNGLGIGLAIAQSIAQNHGGEIVVAECHEGSGARFDVRLPVARDSAEQD